MIPCVCGESLLPRAHGRGNCGASWSAATSFPLLSLVQDTVAYDLSISRVWRCPLRASLARLGLGLGGTQDASQTIVGEVVLALCEMGLGVGGGLGLETFGWRVNLLTVQLSSSFLAYTHHPRRFMSGDTSGRTRRCGGASCFIPG